MHDFAYFPHRRRGSCSDTLYRYLVVNYQVCVNLFVYCKCIFHILGFVFPEIRYKKILQHTYVQTEALLCFYFGINELLYSYVKNVCTISINLVKASVFLLILSLHMYEVS